MFAVSRRLSYTRPMRKLLEKLGFKRLVEVEPPAAPKSAGAPPEPVKRSRNEIRQEQERELCERLHLSDDWGAEEA